MRGMVKKKPKLIIEQYFNNNCIHIMARIDDRIQINHILKFFYRFLQYKKNKRILKGDFSDIFKYWDTTFSSHRISDKSCQLSYLVIDEG